MKFSKIAVLTLLLAASVLIGGGTVFAAEEPSGGIGGRPANPDPSNPRTESIFIYTLNKNQEKKDQVIVSNTTNQAQSVDLYAVDGVVTNTGSYTCQQKVEVSSGIGSWLKLSTNTVELAAHETKKIDFSLSMPDSADVGEHNGCIVFQSNEDPGKVTGNVRIYTRQAIRVVATIPGKLERNITINNFAVEQKDNLQRLMLDIGNVGNVSADVDAYVTLSSLFGSKIYSNGGGYPVLANKQLSLTFVNKEQPFFGGWYVAQATATYDDRPGKFGTTDKDHLITRTSPSMLIFIAPQPGALLLYAVVLLIIIGAGGWLLTQRILKRKTVAAWSDVSIKPGDTIESLSAEHDVSWKKIAKLNNLNPPYTLTVGEKIKLPDPLKTSRDDTKDQKIQG